MSTLQTDTDRVLARLRRYVEHESPSRDEARCAALAEMIAQDARDQGAKVETFDAPKLGKNVRLTFEFPNARPPERPNAPDGKHLLILSHLDTVHPVGTIKAQPFEVKSDRVTGPGIFDMKSGLTLMLEALAWLKQSGRSPARRVQMLVTCDEEIGSHSSRELIESSARGAHTVLVPEPSLPGGKVKTSRKGVATFRLKAHGKAAHAGIEPEKGVSAITELANQILALQALAHPGEGTTVTVGTVSGGTATNVIPALAEAGIDVRYARTSEGERVQRAILSSQAITPNARVEVQALDVRPPLERTNAVIELYQHARDLARELKFDLGEGSTGGGSDGCLTAALGVPTLDGLGPQGGGAHAIDEHILLSDLPFRLAFYAALLERL
jgi:glutamate carboxypeptidase